MLLKLRAFAIILLSITLAACGSGSGTMPTDSAAKWTLTDGGECIGPSWPPVYAACTLDEHPCGGQSVCRSCNSGLGLWAIMPVWSYVCASATVNGSTGLYWQCPSGPVCQLGPGTFVDSQCTEPAVIDGGIDQAVERSVDATDVSSGMDGALDGSCLAPVSGWYYDSVRGCLGDRQVIGCARPDTGCATDIFFVVGADGRCFTASSACIPDGFRRANDADSTCPSAGQFPSECSSLPQDGG